MTLVYKLTDQNGYTKGRTRWGRGVTNTATGSGGLCSSGCIHAYTSPELAVLLNPIHANISKPLLWSGEMAITHRDKSDMKIGGRSLTTLEQLELPSVSTRQRVIFAILCADAAIDLTVKHMPPKALEELVKWRQWRDDYIAGKTSVKAANAAYAAAYAAYAAANAARAAYAAADAAAYAADADTSGIDLAEIARTAMRLGAVK